MNPIDLLKQEHVTIVRMSNDIQRRLDRFRAEGRADTEYVDNAADFIRTYADRCHHGKEEGILFAALEGKELDRGLKILMGDLVREHEWARDATTRLIEANRAYAAGDSEALQDELRLLNQIRRFYPGHVTKEESRFFTPCLAYFTDEEIARMEAAFDEFDQTFEGDVHERYRQLVDDLSAADEEDE